MPVSVALIVGVIAGVVITALAVVGFMRSKMIVPHRSARTFEETCAAIERVVPAADGWSFPMPSFDMYAKLAEKGQEPNGMRRIRLFFVCKPGVASRVLSDTPKIAAIMPCSWAVYELDDDSVWLAKMNIAMMSKLFAGDVAAGMGEVVAADERFMADVLGG
jgi:uncharacterized protein (DUF302 family)